MIVANTLAWALLHAVWEGAAIALILAVALCFVRASRLRYFAACIGLGATLASFVITFFHLMPAADYVVAPPVRSLHAVPLGADALQFKSAQGILLPPWIAPLWLAGVLIFQLRALGGWLAVRRLRFTGVCVAAEPWPTRLSELASSLGIGRPVSLLQSSLAEVPVVIGHLRPVILMPLGLLTGLPGAQIETILMHELAHIRRHDYLVNLLQTFAEGLLFYHPAVWWMSHVIRTERENCCDDMVASNGDAHEYAAALAALAENRWAAGDVAMAATGGSLVKRIRRLLKQPEGPHAALTPALTAALIVITCGFGLLAWQSEPPKPAPAWNKWLTGDVAYIITDAERAAFKRLDTDEERERFVEQFWLRRDPTPGTVENEFKEEHYRRIAFANEHFSPPSGLPGWKTDRGRIYITFGPPDEIDAHPSGVADQPEPLEHWRYRYIAGIGKDVLIDFVGPEYHMTMDPNEKNAFVFIRSQGPGPQMTVTVRQDRTLQIGIPIDPAAEKFHAFTRTTAPNGIPVGTQEFDGNGGQPVYRIEWKPLEPGTYTLTTVVTDSPSGKVHTYTVPVTVK
jgi:GWxTD domain-containing protein